MTNIKIKELASIAKLDQWVSRNGWSGYDPYDVKEKKWVIHLTSKGNRNFAFAMIRELVFEFFYSFPVFSRKLLNIKPRIIPKAMALFSKSYLDLYISTRDKSYLDKSKYCLEWLIQNQSKTQNGFGWGYPFEWQSRKLVPKNTPNGIVTTAVGDAFWNWYKFTNDEKYLDYCIEICKFLSSLPKDNISDHELCFSYTPIFINHVHNLNLFVSEFLLKVGKETNNQNWIDLSNKATNYTINNQREDGSFDYYGPPDKSTNFSDNYHTAYVIRMLHSIWKITHEEKTKKALDKCFSHYINNFFENSCIPKLLPDRKYRIDIHSCAESINCLSELSSLYPEASEIANNVVNWTIDTLQDSTGYFYYGILKSRILKIPFKSKISYIRWGQAWMMKALSNNLITLE